MSINEKQFVFTKHLGSLLVYGTHVLGLTLSIRECQRFPGRQQELYDAGMSDTLKSAHLNSLAADILLFRDGIPIWDIDDLDYKKLGLYWESLHGVWGGRFIMESNGSDPTHFEWGERMR